jgi:hypothetical protein
MTQTKEQRREYYKRNKERLLVDGKKNYADNRDEYRKKHREYHFAHREEICARAHKRYADRRKKVLEYYGGKCTCCGETIPQFLAIDHINGDGKKHRKEIGPMDITAWLVKNNFPDGFQILCHNCNHGRFLNGGICPHQAGLVKGQKNEGATVHQHTRSINFGTGLGSSTLGETESSSEFTYGN